jgi:hypothetical protein
MAGSNMVQIDGRGSRMQIDQMAPVQVDQSLVNITDTTAGTGAVVMIGKVNAFGASNNFNLAGTYPAFNIAVRAGFPHTVTLASPMVPSDGGFNASNTVSGLVNKAVAVGAGIVHDAGNQTWLIQAVTNGGTARIPNWCSLLFANSGGGAITSITYQLPDQAADGRTVTIVTDVAQTGVVFSTAAGLVHPPTSTAVGVGVTLQYIQPSVAWVRVA